MARINFTAGRIRNFSCPEGKNQVFIWDAKQAGLGIRATPKSKTFIFQDRLRLEALFVLPLARLMDYPLSRPAI